MKSSQEFVNRTSILKIRLIHALVDNITNKLLKCSYTIYDNVII